MLCFNFKANKKYKKNIKHNTRKNQITNIARKNRTIKTNLG